LRFLVRFLVKFLNRFWFHDWLLCLFGVGFPAARAHQKVAAIMQLALAVGAHGDMPIFDDGQITE
jgi:hypothetical protein